MGWKPFFIWKGVKSTTMGIEVLNNPSIVRPAQRVDSIYVPGRHGTLHTTDNTFESTVKSVEIAVYDTKRIDPVFLWLQGFGDIIFSDEPDRKYKAGIINKISLDKVIRKIKKALIVFDCQPFKYEVTSQPMVIYVPQAISNIGNYTSEPVIKVYGKGDITITINGRSFTLKGVSDYVVVDSVILNAYRETNQLLNNSMIGGFPFFDTGLNDISWTGNVDRLEINGNWRWL